MLWACISWPKNNVNKDNSLGYSFALTAGLGYAIMNVVSKKGLGVYSSPLVATTIALVFGTMFMTVLSIAISGYTSSGSPTKSKADKRGIIFFLLSGILSGVAQISTYVALTSTPIVVVSPLTNSATLITALGAHLFLRKLEKVTLRIIIASCLVVVGVALVSLGQNLG